MKSNNYRVTSLFMLLLSISTAQAQLGSFLKGAIQSKKMEALYDCAEDENGQLFLITNGLNTVQPNAWETSLLKTDREGNVLGSRQLFGADTLSIFTNIYFSGDSLLVFGRIIDADNQSYIATAYFSKQLQRIGTALFPLAFSDANAFVTQLLVKQSPDRQGFYASGLINEGRSDIPVSFLKPFFLRFNASGEATYYSGKIVLHNDDSLCVDDLKIEQLPTSNRFLGKMGVYVIAQTEQGIIKGGIGDITLLFDSLFRVTDTIRPSYSDSISQPNIGKVTSKWCYMNQSLTGPYSISAFQNDYIILAAGDSGDCNMCGSLYNPSEDCLQLVVLDSAFQLKDKRSLAYDGYRRCRNALPRDQYFPPLTPATLNGISIGQSNIFVGGFSQLWVNEYADFYLDEMHNEMIVGCFDSTYTLKWKKVLKEGHIDSVGANFTLLSLHATRDGGVLAMCTRKDTIHFQNPATYYESDFFAIKLNGEGIVTSLIQLSKPELTITAYPNPGIDRLSFSNLPAGKYLVELYSPDGKLQITSDLDNGAINTAALRNGMYIYNLISENGYIVSAGKWFKQ